jgi:uncharacterized damage-inducible protein DinB
MDGSLLNAAFAHNTWATLRVIDVCADLSVEALQTNVPGTRGPMIETLRHIVAGEAFDLEIVTDIPADEALERMTAGELRTPTEALGAAWVRFLGQALDPDEMVDEVDDSDGFERTAPLAFRLAGTLNHGSDHRSQICTALTTLGIEPPKIDVMSYGLDVDRVTERWPEG